jgi:hypothetical protein
MPIKIAEQTTGGKRQLKAGYAGKIKLQVEGLSRRV